MGSSKLALVRESSFQVCLDRFSRAYADLWHQMPEDWIVPGASVSGREQRRNQQDTDSLVDFMELALQQIPQRVEQREAWKRRVLKNLRLYGRTCLRYPEDFFRILFSREYLGLTVDFIRRVRDFDGRMAVQDLFQALRNVWIMGVIQLFLDRAVCHSNSIFAYSMLYPYSDNFLDDPLVSAAEKAETNRRFGLRLAGKSLEARNTLEYRLFRLVGLIEGDYPRPEFPNVYASLLAIHGAQESSMRQQDDCATLDIDEVLAISVSKGGTSVLADGYLVAGDLSPEEAQFFFGYGVLLQLLDDLQDVSGDLGRSHGTLFTIGATFGPLDGTANKLNGFIGCVLDSSLRFGASRFEPLKDLIRRNCTLLLLQAVALNPSLYSGGYLRHLETFSPVSFPHIRERRDAIMKRWHRFQPRTGRGTDLDLILDMLED